jgi:hypothetical protein
MKKEDNAQGLVPIPIVAVRKCTRCQNFKISYQTLVAFCAVLNPQTPALRRRKTGRFWHLKQHYNISIYLLNKSN